MSALSNEIVQISQSTIDNLLDKVFTLNEQLNLLERYKNTIIPANFDDCVIKIRSDLFALDKLIIEIQKDLKRTQSNLKYAKKISKNNLSKDSYS